MLYGEVLGIKKWQVEFPGVSQEHCTDWVTGNYQETHAHTSHYLSLPR